MRAPPLLALLLLVPAAALAVPPAPEPARWEQPLSIPAPEGAGPSAVFVPPALPGDDVVVPVPRNQNEFSIVANPADPDHLVAGANDYGQGDAWAGFFTSFDGGATWTHGYLPMPGPYTVSGDPALAFGPGGVVYYGGIAFNRGGTNNGANAIFVSRSLDGGLTWTTTFPFASATGSPFHDKPYIATDAAGTLYLTYTHFAPGGTILFTKSLDGGLTWSARKSLGGGQFSQPLASATHVFVAWAGTGGARLAVSADGGLNWAFSTPAPLGLGALPVPFRTFAYPVMALAEGGPHAGRLYLAGPRFDGVSSDLHLQHSDDAGQTWSQPLRLARPGVQLQPWMAVDPEGTVGLAYQDTFLSPATYASNPNSAANATVLLSQSLTVLRPGGLAPDDLAHATMVLTDLPSPATATTFWGDYQGLAATRKGFHPAFGDARAALGTQPCGCAAPAPLDFGTLRVSPLALPSP